MPVAGWISNEHLIDSPTRYAAIRQEDISGRLARHPAKDLFDHARAKPRVRRIIRVSQKHAKRQENSKNFRTVFCFNP